MTTPPPPTGTSVPTGTPIPTGPPGAPGVPPGAGVPPGPPGAGVLGVLYDPGRARVRLGPDHLAVLGQLAAGTPVDPDLLGAAGELRGAGVVDPAGRPVPEIGALLRTVAAPDLLVDVETSSPWGLVGHGVAVGGGQGWSLEGWPGTDVAEYAPLEPLLLVPAVARMVGLRRADPSPLGASALPCELAAPLRAFDGALAALDAIADDFRDSAARAVDSAFARLAPELGAAERSVLVQVVVQRRVAWRVTVSVRGAAPAALAVVDAGPAGLWRREEPAEPLDPRSGSGALAPEAPLRLVRTSPGEVWRALVGLLPDSVPIAPTSPFG